VETTADPSPIVFALDFSDVEAARVVALAVRESVGMLKVGLELFVARGPESVALGRELGLPIFLDLKLHDIPETVERAVGQVAKLGARYATVHAGGGPEMLRRAVRRAQDAATRLDIVAVTVLTSMDAADLRRIGVAADGTEAQAVHLARLAYDEGVRAFVCSPKEVAAIRRALGKDATLITPGIRPSAERAPTEDDQKRVATVTQAIRDGANWLVVGRPIRDATSPAQAANALLEEARRAQNV
jgi:orotidine-5'-phosphate decarboxylase